MSIISPCPLTSLFVGNFKMMVHVLEHRDIESHGLKLIAQKQGELLLKEVVNYTLFMTKTAEKPYPLGLHVPIYPI